MEELNKLRDKYKNNSQQENDKRVISNTPKQDLNSAKNPVVASREVNPADNTHKSNFKTWIIIILLGLLIVSGIYVYLAYEGKLNSTINQSQVCPNISIPPSPPCPICPEQTCNPIISYNLSCPNININLNST